MSEQEILRWFATLWPGPCIRESETLFAAAETLHFIGLSLLLGSLLIVDLRLMGFLRDVPVRAALAFLPLAVAGFLINAATGFGFFTADPFMYWPNIAFKLKMLAVLLAGFNTAVFAVLKHRTVQALGPGDDTDTATKVIAGLSLALWLSVIVWGRLLPSFGE
jgi:hypothetical protein